jgi:hypothetical protein
MLRLQRFTTVRLHIGRHDTYISQEAMIGCYAIELRFSELSAPSK